MMNAWDLKTRKAFDRLLDPLEDKEHCEACLDYQLENKTDECICDAVAEDMADFAAEQQMDAEREERRNK